MAIPATKSEGEVPEIAIGLGRALYGGGQDQRRRLQDSTLTKEEVQGDPRSPPCEIRGTISRGLKTSGDTHAAKTQEGRLVEANPEDWAAGAAHAARPPFLSLFQRTRYPTTRDEVSGDCCRGPDAVPNSPNVPQQRGGPQRGADIRGTTPLPSWLGSWPRPRYSAYQGVPPYGVDSKRENGVPNHRADARHSRTDR